MKNVLIFTLFLAGFAGISAQSLSRTVFGCCGTTSSLGGFNYSYTIGEAVIGTKNASLPALTVGFQQPEFNPLLPVNLLSFYAHWQEGQAMLSWQTLWEVNTVSFIVERSTDGQSFGGIGIVSAAGDAMEPQEYFFPDQQARLQPVNVLYYRLRVVDVYGNYSFSQIEQLRLPESETPFVIYPNPASDQVAISAFSGVDRGFRVSLLNQMGQEVAAANAAQADPQTILIDVSRLAEGTYYLKIILGGEVRFERLIVRH
ncbi:MAG: T9SS type A sorting domain-containing protein [Bacteroidia bacterium]